MGCFRLFMSYNIPLVAFTAGQWFTSAPAAVQAANAFVNSCPRGAATKMLRSAVQRGGFVPCEMSVTCGPVSLVKNRIRGRACMKRVTSVSKPHPPTRGPLEASEVEVGFFETPCLYYNPLLAPLSMAGSSSGAPAADQAANAEVNASLLQRSQLKLQPAVLRDRGFVSSA